MTSLIPTALPYYPISISLCEMILSYLTVREKSLSTRRVSHFFHYLSKKCMKVFQRAPVLHVPQDSSSYLRAMEMCQYFIDHQWVGKEISITLVINGHVHCIEQKYISILLPLAEKWRDYYAKLALSS